MEAIDDENGVIRPDKYDVLLSDITHDVLIGDVARTLDVAYLEEPLKRAPIVDGVMTLNGVLFGSFSRPMVNVAIFSAKHKKEVNVIFLVDTGSPTTFVSESAMAALGFSDHFPDSFKFYIAGCPNVKLQAHMSNRDSHFSDINLIGTNILLKLGAKVTIDFITDSVTIKFDASRASP